MIDVATGHARVSDTNAFFPDDPIGAFAVDARGRAAWAFQSRPRYQKTFEIHAMDHYGDETLDSGDGRPRSP